MLQSNSSTGTYRRIGHVVGPETLAGETSWSHGPSPKARP